MRLWTSRCRAPFPSRKGSSHLDACSGKCSEYEFFPTIDELMSLDEFGQLETGQYDAEKIESHQ